MASVKDSCPEIFVVAELDGKFRPSLSAQNNYMLSQKHTLMWFQKEFCLVHDQSLLQLRVQDVLLLSEP